MGPLCRREPTPSDFAVEDNEDAEVDIEPVEEVKPEEIEPIEIKSESGDSVTPSGVKSEDQIDSAASLGTPGSGTGPTPGKLTDCFFSLFALPDQSCLIHSLKQMHSVAGLVAPVKN